MNKKILKQLLENPYKFSHNTSILELEKVLRKLSFIYYNTGDSIVPDDIYDMLVDVLKNRDPNNPFLFEVGAPVSRDRVNLPYPMASLDKIKPDTGILTKWMKKYKGPYILSDKLDGISAMIHKKNNKIQMYKRGTNLKGQNISFLLSYVLPPTFKVEEMPDDLAIRGELIISKKNFKKIEDKAKNARNAVSGLANSKTPGKREYVAEITEFVAFSIIYPVYKKSEQMRKLVKYGFKTVNNIKKKNLTNDFLSEYLVKRRKEGKYEADGIVVMDNSKAYKTKDDNPDYGFAFKKVLADQMAEVIVRDVLWKVSKDGYLKPRIQIEPVKLVGVTITYATAFNGKYVIDNNLGPGSVIKIIRSGDVIPHIEEVLKPSLTGKPKLPDIPFKFNETKTDIIVKDIYGVQSDNIVIKQMEHFFKVLKVKFISEGVITILVNNGYKTIPSIISIDIDEASEINGIGEKLLTKILNNIRNALNNTSLDVFMAASNRLGRGMGRRKIKVILEAYPKILSKKWSKSKMINKIIKLDGFDTKTATLFSENFKSFVNFFKKINKVHDISHLKHYKTKVNKKLLLKDYKIVFTGFRSKELEEFIETNGGKVSSSVSSNTTLVIHDSKPGAAPGAKLKKAIDLKIKVMIKADFIKTYVK